MRSLRLSAAAALVIAVAGSASAAVLTTPTLFAGGPGAQNVCVATNVGTSPITVKVKMVPGFSDVTEETCELMPNDPFGCQNSVNDLAYCVVTVQGSPKKVRAVMMNRLIVNPFTINSTVEAR